jgi:hypothetical protein
MLVGDELQQPRGRWKGMSEERERGGNEKGGEGSSGARLTLTVVC